MELLKKKHKRAGLIGTIVFHAILLVLFMIFGLTHMEPPPQQGILINFGDSDQGTGEVQPEESGGAPATQQDDVQQEEVTEETAESQEEALTQDTEEAPAVNNEEEQKEEVEEKEEETEEKKVSEELNQLLDKWKQQGDETNSESQGETGQPGDQGDENGDPNSNNYNQGGGGNGTSFQLSGRSMVSTPKIKDTSQEQGKVVVDIVVDKYGKVVKAVPGARGSTTTSSLLYKKAKEAALKTRFNSKPDAPEEQKGKMTFVFILN